MKRVLLITLIILLYLPAGNAQYWNRYNKKYFNNPYSKKNLPHSSADELNHLLRRAKVGKVASISCLIAGPIITYYGYDMIRESDYIGDAFVGILLVMPIGISFSLAAIPGIIISSSRIKRINNLINKSPPVTSITLRPYCSPVHLNSSAHAGISVSVRF